MHMVFCGAFKFRYNVQKTLVRRRSARNNDVPDDLAYFNLNRGSFYQKEHARGHDAVREGFASAHAVTALTLTTFPLRTVDEELREFHRYGMVYKWYCVHFVSFCSFFQRVLMKDLALLGCNESCMLFQIGCLH